MELASTDPKLYYPVKLPCVLFTQEEAESFLRNFTESTQERTRLYEQAVALVEQLNPIPEEVLIYDPRGEVISSIVPGYKFISADVRHPA